MSTTVVETAMRDALEEAKRTGARMEMMMREAGAGRFYVRFPDCSDEVARLLARALDFEREAGLAVVDGKFGRAEHLRAQARAAWAAVRRIATFD